MLSRMLLRRWLPAVALGALLIACGSPSPTDPQGGSTPTPTPAPGGGPSGVIADFALADVNPASRTFGLPVGPRQFLGRASAWYFGHAT
jgi:hypothetical protein